MLGAGEGLGSVSSPPPHASLAPPGDHGLAAAGRPAPGTRTSGLRRGSRPSPLCRRMVGANLGLSQCDGGEYWVGATRSYGRSLPCHASKFRSEGVERKR
jgi:hypothetical protein